MTTKTEFTLESQQGINLEENEVEFKIINFSDKDKKISIIIEKSERRKKK